MLVAALSLYAAFNGGAFLARETALLCVLVVLALLVCVTTASRPFAQASRGLVVAATALSLFAIWTLLSSTWSHAPARALLEYQRTLLYLAALVLFGLLGRGRKSSQVLAGALAFAFAAVAVAALAVWLMPDRYPVEGFFPRSRMSWPTSYWNSTGLIGALLGVWCLGLTTDLRAAWPVRALSAAGVPLGATLVYLTVSRGALLGAGVAAAALLVLCLGRARGLLTGLPVAAAGTVAAVAVCSGLHGLNVDAPAAQALSDGHAAAGTLALIFGATSLVRALACPVDAPLRGMRTPSVSPRAGWVVRGGVVALALVVALGVGAPQRTTDAFHTFTSSGSVPGDLSPGQRFTYFNNNGRIDHWRAAIHVGFDPRPWHGMGAGTYALQWSLGRRDTTFNVIDAHSTYVEVLGEMGIVGLVLLLIALLTLLGALVVRGWREGPAWAGLAAAACGWAVHTGIDWMWETPAVTLWVFAAGGLALSRPRAANDTENAQPPRQRALQIGLGLGCLALAVLPYLVWRSQVHLDDAARAFRRGDCTRTVDQALQANRGLDVRPEPLELLAYCDVRLGQPVLARKAIAAAIRRDPGNWEFRYDQAIVRAATGGNPRKAARAALARNPLDPLAKLAGQWFVTGPPRDWRRLALSAPTLVPGDR